MNLESTHRKLRSLKIERVIIDGQIIIAKEISDGEWLNYLENRRWQELEYQIRHLEKVVIVKAAQKKKRPLTISCSS